MKVFVVLLLAGAVAASSIPSGEERSPVAEQVAAEMASAEQAAHAAHAAEMQRLAMVHQPGRTAPVMEHLLSIFGAPQLSREHTLINEQMGLRGLYEKPFIVAFKPQGLNEIKAFLLKGGLKSLPSNREAGFVRDMLLNGPEKVGITLSGAHALDLPELSMPIRSIVLPQDFNLHSAFRTHQDYPMFPWVYITEKDSLRLGALEKLDELGQFTVHPEMVKIAREMAVPAFHARELSDEGLVLPGFKSIPKVIQVYPSAAHSRIASSYPTPAIRAFQITPAQAARLAYHDRIAEEQAAARRLQLLQGQRLAEEEAVAEEWRHYG